VQYGRRYLLALTWVRRHESTVAVLRRLLGHIREIGLKIKYLLLDRGFFGVAVMEFLRRENLPFLMPVKFSGRWIHQMRLAEGAGDAMTLHQLVPCQFLFHVSHRSTMSHDVSSGGLPLPPPQDTMPVNTHSAGCLLLTIPNGPLLLVEMSSAPSTAERSDRCNDAPPPCIVLRRPTAGERWRRRLAAALAALTWVYLAAVAVVWLLLWVGGDRWWFATVLLFGPRWPYAVPWPAFVLFASLARRRLLWPLAAAGVVLAVPIAGLCLPLGRLAGQAGPSLRVLTCNVDGDAVDAKRLAALIAAEKPDAVALQECPAELRLDWPSGWNVVHAGGMLVASPHPLASVEESRRRHPPSRWPAVNGLRCTLETPQGPVRFCCVHLRTPREGLSETLDRSTGISPARSATLTAAIADRRMESEELVRWLGDFSGPSIVAGDFNMPTDSAIYRGCWSRWANAFSRTGFGFGYSKWTPLGRWSYGLRIDHVLTSPGASPRRSWLGPDIGSDHLPLLAEIAL